MLLIKNLSKEAHSVEGGSGARELQWYYYNCIENVDFMQRKTKEGKTSESLPPDISQCQGFSRLKIRTGFFEIFALSTIVKLFIRPPMD